MIGETHTHTHTPFHPSQVKKRNLQLRTGEKIYYKMLPCHHFHSSIFKKFIFQNNKRSHREKKLDFFCLSAGQASNFPPLFHLPNQSRSFSHFFAFGVQDKLSQQQQQLENAASYSLLCKVDLQKVYWSLLARSQLEHL